MLSLRKLSHYEYKALDSAVREIRLLALSPGNFLDKIEVDLEHVSLDAVPQYDALSYVWGDPDDVRPISVNGYSDAIPANLEAALRCLRYKSEKRTLWIDALCINQHDTSERNHQVSMMQDIYTNAERVIAWIGEATNESGKAIRDINAIGEILDQHKFNFMSTSTTPQALKDLGIDPDGTDWTAIWRILEQPYWSRIWVLQELICGFWKDFYGLIIVCGDAELSPNAYMLFCAFIRTIETSFNNFTIHDDGIMRQLQPLQTLSLRNYPPASGMFSNILALRAGRAKITELIFNTLEFNASDSRDKVFALLGLASDAPIQADYSKPASQIYRELTWSIIQDTKSLDILRGNRNVNDRIGSSWSLPNLSLRNVHTSLLRHQEKKFYDASGKEASVWLEGEGDLLRCRGITIGKLNFVIGPFEPPSGTGNPIMNDEFLEKSRYYELFRYGLGIKDAAWRDQFWRTLILDTDILDPSSGGDSFPAPSELEMGYASIVEKRGPPDDADMETFKNLQKRYMHFEHCICQCCFFTTDSGKMGLGPFDSRAGDIAVVLLGGKYCHVLRPKGDEFELVGEAYIQGGMNGQFMEEDGQGNLLNGRDYVLC